MDQKTRDKAKSNIVKAKVQLSMYHPFFAALVMKRGIHIEDHTETAYVTQSGRIGVGTEFAAKLSVKQCVFLLAHEALHYALGHNFRRFNRDPAQWNKVCDWVINDNLVEMGVGSSIPDGEYRQGSAAYSAEQLYNDQRGGQNDKPSNDQGDSSGGQNDTPSDCPGQGKPEYQPGQGNSDLSETEMPSDRSVQEIMQECAQELAQARTAAKKQGTMSADLERLIGEVINPITPWHILLERFMTGLIRADVTWKRPRKKMLVHNVYLPSSDKVPKIGEVVIGVDTSGSIGEKEISHFVGHINSIIEKCNPEKVHVLHVDSKVRQADEFTMEDYPLAIKKFCGGGGTDMRRILTWIDEFGVEPDVCVVLTDGETPYPEKEPAYPLVWLQTGNETSPVGENIKYRII
jgi:predicted metal-dependent peptidase